MESKRAKREDSKCYEENKSERCCSRERRREEERGGDGGGIEFAEAEAHPEVSPATRCTSSPAAMECVKASSAGAQQMCVGRRGEESAR